MLFSVYVSILQNASCYFYLNYVLVRKSERTLLINNLELFGVFILNKKKILQGLFF